MPIESQFLCVIKLDLSNTQIQILSLTLQHDFIALTSTAISYSKLVQAGSRCAALLASQTQEDPSSTSPSKRVHISSSLKVSLSLKVQLSCILSAAQFKGAAQIHFKGVAQLHFKCCSV
jgi:hypothetical protein